MSKLVQSSSAAAGPSQHLSGGTAADLSRKLLDLAMNNCQDSPHTQILQLCNLVLLLSKAGSL